MVAGVAVISCVDVSSCLHTLSVYAGNYKTRKGSLYKFFKSYSILPFTY